MKFNSLIPELTVSDLQASFTFYTKILGFKEEYSRNGFRFLSLEKNQIMIQSIECDTWQIAQLERPFGRGINFQIQVTSLAFFIERLEKNNYPFFRAPQKNWYTVKNVEYGSYELLLHDPDGYLLRFFEDLGERIDKPSLSSQQL